MQVTRRVARIDKAELSEMPADWTNRERGRHLRGLLYTRGIDPDRLFTVEYFPNHLRWVVMQESAVERPTASPTTSCRRADEFFYSQIISEFWRTARTAFAKLAAHSPHIATFGRKYELPAKPEETSAASLAAALGGRPTDAPDVHFDGEGGISSRHTSRSLPRT
jgi:hypothetical protein